MEFLPVSSDGEKSIVETMETATKNLETVMEVGDTPFDKLEEKYQPLKKLLDKLEKTAHSPNLTPAQKLEQYYLQVADLVPYREGTEEARKIEEVISETKDPVDCNDISSTYFALLAYMGVKSQINFGDIVVEGKSRGYHAWLTVFQKGGNIDLDPYWYTTFIPLMTRNKDVEHFP